MRLQLNKLVFPQSHQIQPPKLKTAISRPLNDHKTPKVKTTLPLRDCKWRISIFDNLEAPINPLAGSYHYFSNHLQPTLLNTNSDSHITIVNQLLYTRNTPTTTWIALVILPSATHILWHFPSSKSPSHLSSYHFTQSPVKWILNAATEFSNW